MDFELLAPGFQQYWQRGLLIILSWIADSISACQVPLVQSTLNERDSNEPTSRLHERAAGQPSLLLKG